MKWAQLNESLNILGLPLWLSCKESACNAGDLGSILGLRRSPGEGKGYSIQYSGMENSMDCIVPWKCDASVKEASHKRPQSVQVHLYRMPRTGKSMGTQSRLVSCWGVGAGAGKEDRWFWNDCQCRGGDEEVLNLDCGHACTKSHWNVHFKRLLLWYESYIAIQKLKGSLKMNECTSNFA